MRLEIVDCDTHRTSAARVREAASTTVTKDFSSSIIIPFRHVFHEYHSLEEMQAPAYA
ncbi:hypothetical protein [Burkholderia gladioli]|uniref:hypothetical protein n=1 Tax=Burkholderia gladioli TaxID=28095 RepID=UPI001E6509B5|nr:hypothetical protein [Burkholderia gladioli]